MFHFGQCDVIRVPARSVAALFKTRSEFEYSHVAPRTYEFIGARALDSTKLCTRLNENYSSPGYGHYRGHSIVYEVFNGKSRIRSLIRRESLSSTGAQQLWLQDRNFAVVV